MARPAHTEEIAESDVAVRDPSPRRDATADARPGKPTPPAANGGSKGLVARLRATVGAHPYGVAAIVVVFAATVAGGIVWWLHARHFETSDDAFIDARTVAISAQVAGAIVAVPVTDNELVAAGAVLVDIDRRDFEAAVAQARAQVEQARAGVADAAAQIDAQTARINQAHQQVEQAQAALTFAESESSRAQALLKRGFGTEQQAQQNASNFQQGKAALQQAQANMVAAEKQTAVLEAARDRASGQLDQAQAQLDQAEANLTRTRIAAPVAGRPAAISAAVGATAQVGQALMMFVPRDVWVTANFKETQLTDMRPGQPVDIAIDAYPGRSFAGHVDSIQAGSGAAFSLLPPQNATGNYVKVVQRVPVKIVFDAPPDVYLGPGMSVVPTVTVR
jgi:membrane fusion protein (multidrug efflux system)